MKYWIIIAEEPCGPYLVEELKDHGLTAETPVWRSGMTDWQPAGSLPELAELLAASAALPDLPEQDETPMASTPPAVPEPPAIPADAEMPEPPASVPESPYESYPQAADYTSEGGEAEAGRESEPMPPTYLWWSIGVTVLCCTIIGIVAIVYSTKVSTAWRDGNYAAARKYSETTAWLVQAAIVLGLISFPFSLLISMI